MATFPSPVPEAAQAALGREPNSHELIVAVSQTHRRIRDAVADIVRAAERVADSPADHERTQDALAAFGAHSERLSLAVVAYREAEAALAEHRAHG